MVKPAVAIIKHANPCGIAIAAPQALDPIASAHLRAHECDPVSAFGGVIAANRTVTLKMAENLRDIFTEVIVAPDFEPEALEVFRLKKNLRVLRLPDDWRQEPMDVRLLSADSCSRTPTASPMTSSRSRRWELVTGERPRRARRGQPRLRVEGVPRREVERDRARAGSRRSASAWGRSTASTRAASPSSAPATARGLGRGIRRVLPVRGRTAGAHRRRDPHDRAAGRSVRDQEVIDAARAAGVTMFFTGERHFFH
jgi:phosphoribosylaminoimidazolecarboxamide formyltransferase/IMP cyclohydrolase